MSMSARPDGVWLGVLGPLAGGPGPAPLGDGPVARLCSRLLVAAGRPISAEQLRADVWEDTPTSPSIVRVTVHRLRAALAGTDSRVVERIERGGWVLRSALLDVDATRFESLLDAAADQAPPEALATLDAALGLWRGRPFEGLEDAEWLWPETQRLVELREKALDARAEALLAARRPDDAIPELAEAAAAAPTRERRWAALMVAFHRAGRTADALLAFRRHEAALHDELGIAPSASIRRLDLRIRDDDGSSDGRSRPELFAEADPSVTARRAARYLAGRGVLDEAARQADRAVQLAVSEAGRATALVIRAEIATAQSRLAEAADNLAEAVLLARRLGDGPLLARVALVRFGHGIGASDEESQDLLAALLEPLTLLGSQRPERIELLCAAMFVLLHSSGGSEAHRLHQEAASLASTLASPRARALAHMGQAVADDARGEAPEVRLPLIAAAVAATDDGDDPRLALAARYLDLQVRLEAGDLRGIEAGLARFEEVGRASLLPFAATRPSLVRAGLLLARGQVADAQAHIDVTFDLAGRLGVGSALNAAVSQQALVLLESARFDDLLQLLGTGAGPGGAASLAIVAVTTAAAGDTDASRTALDQWLDAAPGEAASPFFPIMTCLAVEAAARCRHLPVLALGRQALTRLTGRFTALGVATLTLGPVDRYLAHCAEAADQRAEAIALAEAALSIATEAGAEVWAARCALDLASLLDLEGDGPGRDRARTLLMAAAASPAAATSPLLALQLQPVAPV